MAYGKSRYRREWEPTEFDTGTAAIELRKRVVRYVMNENFVPKRWRFVDAIPAIQEAEQIRKIIIGANSLKTNTNSLEYNIKALQRRIQMQGNVIALCDNFDLKIQDIVADCQEATFKNIAPLTDGNRDVRRLCVNWQKSDVSKLRDLLSQTQKPE